MAVLRLRRTRPTQGQPVTVFFEGEGGTEHGRVTLPFDVWVKFSKILQSGIEQNNVRKYYDLKISITGIETPEAGELSEALAESATIRSRRLE